MINNFSALTMGDFYWRLKNFCQYQGNPKKKLPSQLSTKEYFQSKFLQGGRASIWNFYIISDYLLKASFSYFMGMCCFEPL